MSLVTSARTVSVTWWEKILNRVDLRENLQRQSFEEFSSKGKEVYGVLKRVGEMHNEIVRRFFF